MSDEEWAEPALPLITHCPLPITRHLGLVEYQPTFQAMQDFTAQRGPDTPDEIWLLQHPPVYTQGLAGKPEHLLRTSEIPVVKIDRGGQITYHGPGQVVAYILLDLKRNGVGVKELVRRMEQAVINLLAAHGVGNQAFYDWWQIHGLDGPRSTDKWYPTEFWWWGRAAFVADGSDGHDFPFTRMTLPTNSGTQYGCSGLRAESTPPALSEGKKSWPLTSNIRSWMTRGTTGPGRFAGSLIGSVST